MPSLDPPAWAALDLRLQVPQSNFHFKAIPASVLGGVKAMLTSQTLEICHLP